MRMLLNVASTLALGLVFAGQVAADQRLQIGANFTGSSFGADSSLVPPDTNGAVGRRHIVEFINGHYAVYRKTDGRRLESLSLDQFWASAGANARGFLSDPRILYDSFSGRWFASTPSFNSGNGPDDLLFAVSRTADPTQGWSGFTIPFAGPVGTFVDFPTLGIDRDAVFVFTNGTVVVVPKSDLLAAIPSVAGASVLPSRDLLTPSGTKVQPIVSLDNATLPESLLGPWDVEGTLFRRWRIVGTAAAPTLDVSGGFIPVTPFQGLGNQGALQPGSGIEISTSSATFASSIVMRNAVLWGVQTVANLGRAALRWFAVDANTNALLQEGLIADPVRDVFMGSIAVNACNDVVIGFNQSGPSDFVSAYAVAGSTSNNITTFGEPRLLKSGVARYEVTGGAVLARWGDYSTTVVDPRHPLTFWTFQEWPSAPDVWSIQITELKLHKGARARKEAEDDDRADAADVPDRAEQEASCRS
jgi:hypothetical protein